MFFSYVSPGPPALAREDKADQRAEEATDAQNDRGEPTYVTKNVCDRAGPACTKHLCKLAHLYSQTG